MLCLWDAQASWLPLASVFCREDAGPRLSIAIPFATATSVRRQRGSSSKARHRYDRSCAKVALCRLAARFLHQLWKDKTPLRCCGIGFETPDSDQGTETYRDSCARVMDGLRMDCLHCPCLDSALMRGSPRETLPAEGSKTALTNVLLNATGMCMCWRCYQGKMWAQIQEPSLFSASENPGP